MREPATQLGWRERCKGGEEYERTARRRRLEGRYADKPSGELPTRATQ
ncbi:MAG: hypothetical protein IJP65_10150 [Bacteroidales bacterium]|nr:hypothetical protein [Bacteroidales bacterium]